MLRLDAFVPDSMQSGSDSIQNAEAYIYEDTVIHRLREEFSTSTNSNSNTNDLNRTRKGSFSIHSNHLIPAGSLMSNDYHYGNQRHMLLQEDKESDIMANKTYKEILALFERRDSEHRNSMDYSLSLIHI